MVTISPEPTDSPLDPSPQVDVEHLLAWLDTSEKYGRETVTLPVAQVRALLAELKARRHLGHTEGVA